MYKLSDKHGMGGRNFSVMMYVFLLDSQILISENFEVCFAVISRDVISA
jgi:hypothetical protein